ncbi:30S ribosomal protein S8 [candidate division NPL-UPA2 bacterium]|nr:30S ribosomal protein S8 [candidate division NPL-UPA2 bacterium]
MGMTDPIADLLNRIRNSSRVHHDKIDIPASKLKEEIAKVLKAKGFIKNYRKIEDRKQGVLRIYLRYGPNREEVINGLRRISKPGLRVYVKKGEVPKVLGGSGIAILSTPKGVMADAECRKEAVGGEVLCYVW